MKGSDVHVVPANVDHVDLLQTLGYADNVSAVTDGWNRVVTFKWSDGHRVLALECPTLREAHKTFRWVLDTHGIIPDSILLDVNSEGINTEFRDKGVAIFLRYGRIPKHFAVE